MDSVVAAYMTAIFIPAWYMCLAETYAAYIQKVKADLTKHVFRFCH
jgi:hypothetical protein